MATAGGTRGAGPERAYAPSLPAVGASGTTASKTNAAGSNMVTLDRDESHHLVRARRVRVGDAVVLFDGCGGSVLGTLVSDRAESAVIEVTDSYPDREPRRCVVVATSVPGPSRLDDLVSSLAELGVTAWLPIVCERSDRKFVEGLERRTDRLGRLVREAAKVSGRSRFMKIAVAQPFADTRCADGATTGTTNQGATLASFLLDPDPSAASLHEALAAAGGASPRGVELIVGPEGGFTPAEIEFARRTGSTPASLGACALTTELAAVAAAAIALCS